MIEYNHKIVRELTHYQETLEARRARLGSTTIKTEGTLCDNGSYHAKTTNVRRLVTCPKCLKKMS